MLHLLLSITMVTPATLAANHKFWMAAQIHEASEIINERQYSVWSGLAWLRWGNRWESWIHQSHHLDGDLDHPSSTIKWLWSFSSAFVSAPSYWLSLFTFFLPFLSPLILFKLKSVPAVCHNDTILASHPPSLLPLFPLLLTLCLCVCLISPDAFMDRERMPLPLSLCKIFLPTLSLPLSLTSMLVQPIQPSHCGSWSPFLLSSFTLGYNVKIRLSVPFYFSGLLHCFGLCLCLSLLPLWYLGHSAAFCVIDLLPWVTLDDW